MIGNLAPPHLASALQSVCVSSGHLSLVQTAGGQCLSKKRVEHPHKCPPISTGRYIISSPRLCCYHFGHFPPPAWALGSCSSGPQAGELPKLIATEPRTRGDVSPCTSRISSCPFIPPFSLRHAGSVHRIFALQSLPLPDSPLSDMACLKRVCRIS